MKKKLSCVVVCSLLWGGVAISADCSQPSNWSKASNYTVSNPLYQCGKQMCGNNGGGTTALLYASGNIQCIAQYFTTFGAASPQSCAPLYRMLFSTYFGGSSCATPASWASKPDSSGILHCTSASGRCMQYNGIVVQTNGSPMCMNLADSNPPSQKNCASVMEKVVK